MADEEGEGHAVRLDQHTLPLTNILSQCSDEPADGLSEPLGSAHAGGRLVGRLLQDRQHLPVV
eukprot:4302235-Heterocapsa_arctica.AAC.1